MIIRITTAPHGAVQRGARAQRGVGALGGSARRAELLLHISVCFNLFRCNCVAAFRFFIMCFSRRAELLQPGRREAVRPRVVAQEQDATVRNAGPAVGAGDRVGAYVYIYIYIYI